MVLLLGNVQDKIILEPCAGEGAFLKELSGTPFLVDALDIDGKHIDILKNKFPSWVNSIHADFIDIFISNDLFNPSVLRSTYDAVICNPPYGLRFSAEYRKKIKSRYPKFYARESYGLFMYFSISQIKKGGRYVFIVPDTFLTSNNHRPLRKFLSEKGRPTHIILFKSKRFKTVNFGYGSFCIIAGFHNRLQREDKISWVDAKDHIGDLSINIFDQCTPAPGSYLLEHVKEGWVHPSLYSDLEIPASTIPLGEIAECRTGIYTGNNKRFCAYDSKRPPIRKNGHPINWKAQVKTSLLKDDEKRIGLKGQKHYVPLVRGGHREPFASIPNVVDWSKEAVAYYADDKKARLQNASFYFKKGLAVPMVTSGRISASLMENAIFDQGVVGVFPKNKKITNYLLIYLNGNFVSNTVKKIINPGANNSSNYIKRIPVPNVSSKNLEEENRIVRLAKEKGWESIKDLREKFIIKIMVGESDHQRK